MKLLKNRFVQIIIGLAVLTCCVALLSGVTVFQIKYPILIFALFVVTTFLMDTLC